MRHSRLIILALAAALALCSSCMSCSDIRALFIHEGEAGWTPAAPHGGDAR